MSVKDRDRLHQIAEQVANCFAESGYAFVEDDKLEGLAALLGSFLTVAGIPINPLDPSDRPHPRLRSASPSEAPSADTWHWPKAEPAHPSPSVFPWGCRP
jgi:hypothetical protein